MIMATHQISPIAGLADEIPPAEGDIVEQGPPAQLLALQYQQLCSRIGSTRP